MYSSKSKMDLLVVAQPADVAWLRYTLPQTLKYLQPIRCYVLTYDTASVQTLFPECTVVSLSRLPFTYDDVARMAHSSPMRTLTQLAHLYAHHILPLTRPVVCMDATAAVLAPVPATGRGTRLIPGIHTVRHVTTLLPGTKNVYLDDLPFYVITPEQSHALHVHVSTHHRNEPFWRVYISASASAETSDKALYASWIQRSTDDRETHVVHRRLKTYSDATYPPPAVHVVSCEREHVPTMLAQTTWTRVRRWVGDTHVTSLPIHAAALDGLPVGTVVHYGSTDAPSDVWKGWTYVGVDVESTDLCVDPLPHGTLALCTNLFSRLSYAHALTVLARMVQVYPTVMVVDFIPDGTPRINTDRPTGQWGVVWWDIAPYSALNAVLNGYVPLSSGKLAFHRILKPRVTHKNGERDRHRDEAAASFGRATQDPDQRDSQEH